MNIICIVCARKQTILQCTYVRSRKAKVRTRKSRHSVKHVKMECKVKGERPFVSFLGNRFLTVYFGQILRLTKVNPFQFAIR